jgi:hypothetical protein
MNTAIVYFGPELHITVPTVTEAYHTIRRMKDNRAPGEDAITAKLIKGGGISLWKNIHQLKAHHWTHPEPIPSHISVTTYCTKTHLNVTEPSPSQYSK